MLWAISTMSATTDEAVGICPAPRPENMREPQESPRMCTALYTPPTDARRCRLRNHGRVHPHLHSPWSSLAMARSLMR